MSARQFIGFGIAAVVLTIAGLVLDGYRAG